jgi:hypothetical protein
MKSTTKSKLKYNLEAYKRFEFNVRRDSMLYGIIERYKQDPDNNFSELIKACLCKHFGIDRDEADFFYVPYHYGRNGEHIINNVLDKYFQQ